MNPEDAVDLGREALRTCLIVGGPILAVGLLIGLAVGVLQAMTQVQDQTVSFVPKILLMILALALALPWLSEQMVDFTKESFESPVISLSGKSSSFAPSVELPRDGMQPNADGGQRRDEVAFGRSTSSMPMLGQSNRMPNLTNRAHSSMPMMGGLKKSSAPRMADVQVEERTK